MPEKLTLHRPIVFSTKFCRKCASCGKLSEPIKPACRNNRRPKAVWRQRVGGVRDSTQKVWDLLIWHPVFATKKNRAEVYPPQTNSRSRKTLPFPDIMKPQPLGVWEVRKTVTSIKYGHICAYYMRVKHYLLCSATWPLKLTTMEQIHQKRNNRNQRPAFCVVLVACIPSTSSATPFSLDRSNVG